MEQLMRLNSFSSYFIFVLSWGIYSWIVTTLRTRLTFSVGEVRRARTVESSLWWPREERSFCCSQKGRMFVWDSDFGGTASHGGPRGATPKMQYYQHQRVVRLRHGATSTRFSLPHSALPLQMSLRLLSLSGHPITWLLMSAVLKLPLIWSA